MTQARARAPRCRTGPTPIRPKVYRGRHAPPSSTHVGLNAGGLTWLDLIVLERDQRGRPRDRRLDNERIEAARLVIEKWKFSKRPIAPQRWRAIGGTAQRELNARAEANNSTPQRELEKCVVSALFQAVGDAGGILTQGLKGKLRTSINELVTEDLLGPGWRRQPREASLGLSE